MKCKETCRNIIECDDHKERRNSLRFKWSRKGSWKFCLGRDGKSRNKHLMCGIWVVNKCKGRKPQDSGSKQAVWSDKGMCTWKCG